MDGEYTFFGTPPPGRNATAFTNMTQVRSHIKRTDTEKLMKEWNHDDSSQSAFMKNGYEPMPTIEFFRKELRGRHMGTLCDVVAGTITQSGRRATSPNPTRAYCEHKSKKQIPLTPGAPATLYT